MLRGKMINYSASLNNFRYIGSVQYFQSDKVTMNFQIWEPQLEMRYIPPSTAIVTLMFNNQDGTTFTKTGSFIDSGDRSLVQVLLSTSDTSQLLDGNVTFTLDLLGDGTQVLRGIIFQALQQCITNIPIL